jgi:hypothetical protein
MVRIQSLHVICTPDGTSVSATVPALSGPHLLITARANGDGTNLEALFLTYSNHNSTPPLIQTSITDPAVFQAMTHYMQGSGTTVTQRCDSHMNQLPRDDVSVIAREYGRYFQEGRILDGFIAGVASYLGLLLLFENETFRTHMPFQFSVPTTVATGHALTQHMLSYMSLPLTALAKITTGVLGNIVNFVQSFINMWDTAFLPGPEIGSEARMCLEIITGMTQHTSEALAQIQRDRQAISITIAKLGDELRKDMESEITLFRRELSNINAEARSAVTEVGEQLQALRASLNEASQPPVLYSNPDKARLQELERRIEVLNLILEGDVPKQPVSHNPFDVRKRTGPSPYISKRKPTTVENT